VIERIVSGGQTGVDRAALDAGLAFGVPVGGWCPRGRLAEDGPIDPRYPLRETPSASYRQRTEWNVRDSDGTLVLTRGRPSGGTALTIARARQHRRPVLVLDLSARPGVPSLLHWLETSGIAVLNVAGPRESQQPGIQAESRAFLEDALRLLAG
jgi:hypothetical protein